MRRTKCIHRYLHQRGERFAFFACQRHLAQELLLTPKDPRGSLRLYSLAYLFDDGANKVEIFNEGYSNILQSYYLDAVFSSIVMLLHAPIWLGPSDRELGVLMT